MFAMFRGLMREPDHDTNQNQCHARGDPMKRRDIYEALCVMWAVASIQCFGFEFIIFGIFSAWMSVVKAYLVVSCKLEEE